MNAFLRLMNRPSWLIATAVATTSLLAATAGLALGQPGPTAPAAPAGIPAPGPQTDQPYAPQPILPGGVVVSLYEPGSEKLDAARIAQPEEYTMMNGVPGRIQSIVSIHNPSVEIHTVDPSINTGAVVILAAGGGHRTLNVGAESADFVPYFYQYGVNNVILRNRLRSDGYNVQADAVNDALQAVRLVRHRAAEWGYDPNKIGLMGFSAGAELAAPAAVQFAQFDEANNDPSDPLAGVSSRPDFVALLYPGPTPFTNTPDATIPNNAPPAFIATAGSGDQDHAVWAMDYFNAMLRHRNGGQAGIPNIEIHVYGNGVHAGGLKDRAGAPFGTWQERYVDWFRDLGFLQASGTETKAARDSAAFAAGGGGRRGGLGRRGQGRRGARRGPGADGAPSDGPPSDGPPSDGPPSDGAPDDGAGGRGRRGLSPVEDPARGAAP